MIHIHDRPNQKTTQVPFSQHRGGLRPSCQGEPRASSESMAPGQGHQLQDSAQDTLEETGGRHGRVVGMAAGQRQAFGGQGVLSHGSSGGCSHDLDCE